MESTPELKVRENEQVDRRADLELWLSPFDSLQAMQGDASQRRYFRVQKGGTSYVVMDAPPSHEDCKPYLAIAKALRQKGLKTPEIFEADINRGFLLISDFGDATYLKTLTSANADQLYDKALDALAILQACRKIEGHAIHPFSAPFMKQEWVLFKEWMLKLLGLSLPLAEKELDACYDLLIGSAISQAQVLMHRDYHSANLMVLPGGEVGILDFQDAFIGPVTYDLVSLLRDCYIDWPKEKVEYWVSSYLQKLKNRGELTRLSDQQFLRMFDFMGMQRHLKALMTFSRKAVRDNQPRYLQHVPRTLSYLIDVSQTYSELASLHDYLRVTIAPAFERISK